MTTKKTIGQIACDEFAKALAEPTGAMVNSIGDQWPQYSAYGQKAWEAAANAVLEEAAKVADAEAKDLREMKDSGEAYTVACVASLIRQLKSPLGEDFVSTTPGASHV